MPQHQVTFERTINERVAALPEGWPAWVKGLFVREDGSRLYSVQVTPPDGPPEHRWATADQLGDAPQ